ncbi:hypothetical protein EVAR_55104_1 [Eumeta japonica]|uniref:Reverse transcriptase domain-containing protein n=1 Tax=Eumeta variegata TaxID=151549 RepID=A0A4C1YIL0_EUMVA|nr:hypothetical protein EVAR_55104_1 [Eumeta japonica]
MLSDSACHLPVDSFEYFGKRKVLGGVRYGVASPWLLDDGCLHNLKEYDCGLKMDELPIKCLLYADKEVIFAPLSCELQDMLTKFVNINDFAKKRDMELNDKSHDRTSAVHYPFQMVAHSRMYIVSPVISVIYVDSPRADVRRVGRPRGDNYAALLIIQTKGVACFLAV